MENLFNQIVENSEEFVESSNVKVSVPKFRLASFLTNLVEDTKALKPSDKEKKIAEADTLIEEGEHLSTLYESYKDEYVVRGNKALYELLTSIYAYALRINESLRKEMVIERMADELKSKFGIGTTKNTPWLTAARRTESIAPRFLRLVCSASVSAISES